MISNTDSMLFVYSTEHIRVKVYLGRARGNGFSRRAGQQLLYRLVLSYPECWVRFGAFRLALLSSPDLGNQRTGNIQFNRRWLQLLRKCHANGGKRWQKCGKRQQRK